MCGIRLALAIFILAHAALCQSAQISGLIHDPSAALIVSAEVTVRNEQTGGQRFTLSNESGLYSVPSLSPGVYRVKVRASGFETILREGVTLQVGDNARLDFTMAVGDMRTVVTVEGGLPKVDSDDGSVGTVIDRQLIEKMPLNGRGIQALIELAPGVAVAPVSARNSGGQFVINGQRSDANYFTIDGVSTSFAVRAITDTGLGNTNFSGRISAGNLPALSQFGTFSNLVSSDALQEFRIQTSSFSPEFGRSPGGQIGLNTRSGTNQYHGSLFEYLRNEAMDANDWFNNYNGVSKPALRSYDFGGTLGGPVDIPHLYRGANRTFFFFSYEDVLLKQPRPAIQTLVPMSAVRQDAPANLAPLLNASPLPNRAMSISLTGYPGWGEFVGTGWLKQSQATFGLRLDHYLSDKVSVFARYDRSPSVTHDRPYTNLANTQLYTISTQTLTVGLTQAVRPNLVHEMRWNLSGQDVIVRDAIDNYGGARPPPDSLLFPAGNSEQNSSTTISSFNLGLSTGLMSSTQGRQVDWVEGLSLVLGTHQFKFGSDLDWFSPVDKPPRLNSTVVFAGSLYNPDGTYTDVPAIVLENRSLRNVVYSIPSFSAFAQDEWRANPALTVTYGLRWEVNPAPRVTSGQAAFLTQLTTLKDFTHVTALAPGQQLYATQYSHIAPRIGMAWRLFEGRAGKTILRGGAGVFYDTAQNGFTERYAEPYGYVSYTNTPFGASPGAANILDTQSPLNYQMAAAPGYTLPRTYQWNISLQQSVGPQTISAAYVGAVARHLVGSLQTVPTFPDNSIYILSSRFSSNFNSLQLQFDRRLSRRVQALVSYTWAHSIDNLSNDVIDTGLDAYFNPNFNRGSSDFDIRHSVNGAFLFELPSPRGKIGDVLLRNWNANVIFMARSAPPTDVAAGKIPNSELITRPDIVFGQPFYLYGSGYPGGKRLNPAAFITPPEGVLEGNLGRNVLRAFGAWEADLAMERQVHLSEGLSLGIRADAFNVFNHPNFGSASSFLNSPQTAYLTSNPANFGYSNASLGNMLGLQNVQGQLNPAFQVGQSRSFQFALRLRF